MLVATVVSMTPLLWSCVMPPRSGSVMAGAALLGGKGWGQVDMVSSGERAGVSEEWG